MRSMRDAQLQEWNLEPRRFWVEAPEVASFVSLTKVPVHGRQPAPGLEPQWCVARCPEMTISPRNEN